MNRKPLVASVILLFIAAFSFSQTDGVATSTSLRDEVRVLRDQVEKSTALTAYLQSRILELCDGAQEALVVAAANRREAARFERNRTGLERMVEARRAELAKPEATPMIRLPADLTGAQAEDALARERSRLAANRSAL